MEQSAYEAIITGVNVFIFIIALSAGIMLMTSILDMAEYANENAVIGMNGSLAESVGTVEERVYSGEQILSYYRRVSNNSKYDFRIKTSELGSEQTLSSYIESESVYNYINDKFELQYKGVINEKDTYVFVLKQD